VLVLMWVLVHCVVRALLRERAKMSTTLSGMRAVVAALRAMQDRLRAEAAAAAAVAGQGMAAAISSIGVLGKAANNAVDRFSVVQKERRQLSNRLLELKGNIRVFLRIRPLFGNEIANGEFAALSAASSLEAQISGGPGWGGAD